MLEQWLSTGEQGKLGHLEVKLRAKKVGKEIKNILCLFYSLVHLFNTNGLLLIGIKLTIFKTSNKYANSKTELVNK